MPEIMSQSKLSILNSGTIIPAAAAAAAADAEDADAKEADSIATTTPLLL